MIIYLIIDHGFQMPVLEIPEWLTSPSFKIVQLIAIIYTLKATIWYVYMHLLLLLKVGRDSKDVDNKKSLSFELHTM